MDILDQHMTLIFAILHADARIIVIGMVMEWTYSLQTCKVLLPRWAFWRDSSGWVCTCFAKNVIQLMRSSSRLIQYSFAHYSNFPTRWVYCYEKSCIHVFYIRPRRSAWCSGWCLNPEDSHRWIDSLPNSCVDQIQASTFVQREIFWSFCSVTNWQLPGEDQPPHSYPRRMECGGLFWHFETFTY